MIKTYRIVTSNYVAGLDAEDGTVVNAAPILRWAIGKRLTFVVNYLKGRFGENFSCREYHV